MAELYQFESMLGPAEDFPAGSVEWAKRISNRLQTGTRFISRHSAQHIGATVFQIWKADPKPWEVFPEGHPFNTPDDYFIGVTGIAWDALLGMLLEFGVSPEEVKGALADAQAKYRGQGTRTDTLPYEIRKLSSRGGDGGTSAAYLLRRLARENPDLLTDYEHGKFRSARAAAKAAGIIKDPVPLDMLLRYWKRASPTEREVFLTKIGQRR